MAGKAFQNRHSNDTALMGMLTSKEDVINAAALVKILTKSLLLQERRAPGSIMAKPLPKPTSARKPHQNKKVLLIY